MKLFKTIIHSLSFFCYLFIIVYALVCLPYIFGYKPLVVLTGSMEPTFKTGSVIYYKSVNRDQIKEGDIITFKSGNSLVSHRVNKIDNYLYETKGDANNTVDATRIEFSSIVGKDAEISIPYVGFYVKYINEHIYLLFIVAAILVLDFILSNIKPKKDKEEKVDI